MPYKLQHIPVDDIPQSDLVADLREVAHLNRAGSAHRVPDKSFRDRQPHLTNDVGEPAITDNYYKTFYSNIRPVASPLAQVPSVDSGHQRQGGAGADALGGSLAATERKGKRVQIGDKVYTDVDLALARSRVEDSRRRLEQDTMMQGAWGKARTMEGERGGEEEGLDTADELEGERKAEEIPETVEEKEETRRTDNSLNNSKHSHRRKGKLNHGDTVSEKQSFVKALRRKQQQKLKEFPRSTAVPGGQNDFRDLMPKLKSLVVDDADHVGSDLSPADISDEMKVKKYKNVKLKQTGDDGKDDDSHPFEETSSIRKPVPSKTTTGIIADEKDYPNPKATLRTYVINSHGKSVKKTGDKIVKTGERKHKKHRVHHGKKVKGPTYFHGPGRDIDHDAVAKMVDEHGRVFSNESAEFRLVEKGKDRVDLPLSESDQHWLPRIHGRRDIIMAGSIVMALGLIIILASIIALVRQRFVRRKKKNVNNNKSYRKLGSSSETEVLKKSKRSLFPLESSEDEGATSSDSDEDAVVYHQARVSRGY